MDSYRRCWDKTDSVAVLYVEKYPNAVGKCGKKEYNTSTEVDKYFH